MIFTIISEKNDFTLNPLIKKVRKELLECQDEIIIIDSFKYAVELFDKRKYEVNYLNERIKSNIWWSENIDETIKNILNEFIDQIKIIPFFSKKYIQNKVYFEYQNDRVIIIANEMNMTDIKIFDKTIGGYFDEKIEFKKNLTYENTFRSVLKTNGFVEKEYTLSSLEKYIQKLFGNEYELYVFFVLTAFYSNEHTNHNFSMAWYNLFFVEDYFKNIKIYGVDQTTKYDFNFQKDDNNEYYIQYEYNASESVTGRMFPVNLNKYQSLQTLPKEDRNLLKAEKGYIFLEYDFKNFELSILYDLYRKIPKAEILEPIEKPHEYICTLFDLNPIEHRNIGKQINYAIIYGMSFDGLINLIKEYSNNNEIEIIEKLQNYTYYKMSKIVSKEVDKTIFENNGKKFLLNCNNRLIKFEKEHAILNNYIQSVAADIVYHKIVKIVTLFHTGKFSEKNKILLQNHDSILIQLELKVIEKTNLLEEIDCLMRDSIYNIFYPTLELKSGFDWKNLS